MDFMNPPFMYFVTFMSSFCYIFTKSFQQSNVTHKQYKWILPTSMIMAGMEVFMVSVMAKHGVGVLVFFVGFGGGLGSIAATYLHDRMLHRDKA